METYNKRENNLIIFMTNEIKKWYTNAKIDYNICGKLNNITIINDTLIIEVEEDGEILTNELYYINDYTSTQLFNIWMDQISM